jgi:hypothetical protein
MLAKLRPHLSYANVMASIAVFAALGGTSVAAVSLKKNSVGSTQIQNSSLTGTDVKNSSLTTSDVKNKSLLAKDFKAGQLPTGARGLTGAQGAKGDTGAPGEAVAYATVDDTGALVSARSKNVTQANIDTDTVTGTVCFTGLPFTPQSAMTSNQPVFGGGEQDVIVGAYVATGDVSQGDCLGQILVRTFDISSNSLQNRAFTIWLED